MSCKYQIALMMFAWQLAGVTASAELIVQPPEIKIRGHRASAHLLVSVASADGTRADVTRQAQFECAASTIAIVTSNGRVIPRGHGSTEVIIRHANDVVRVPVQIEGYAQTDPVDFETDVIAALSKAGCNQGACHGSPQGKNGFRLSLRGFDPALDYMTLTHEDYGRRTNPNDADSSLILQKGLGEVPHQGGSRFRRTSHEYQILRAWIESGCKPSVIPAPPASNSKNTKVVTAPKLLRLEVLPESRHLPENRPEQQLIARAHFDNGEIRDVTDLSVFSTNEKEAAEVSSSGLVTFHSTSEVSFLVRYLDRITGVRLSYLKRDPQFVFKSPVEANVIDRHAFAKQRELQLVPTELASDETFLRRLYLDVTGTLPTADAAQRFLDSTDPNKRSKLVDEVLDRDDYALFWALKWADLMRGSDVTISKRGVHAFHRYLVDRFRNDRPFDEFARETLTSLGNTLHKPGANFHRIARTPDEAAEAMAQLFLGVRIGCAKCHNHPFEAITQDDYYGLAAYFARVKFKGKQFMLDDEIVYLDRGGDVRHPTKNVNMAPIALGELPTDIGPEDDRRESLVRWLTRRDNPYFAKSTVNRVWYHLFGRGIVEPVDDFRDTNPPSNPELLDALAEEFLASGYRIKPVLRLALNSSTYQLSSKPAGQSRSAPQSAPYFTNQSTRMLGAEQLLDAIAMVEGIPADFAGHPRGTRAIELAEGAIEHPFLKAFSRPVRDVTCECAREDDPSLSQVIHLINNREIINGIKAEQGRLAQWMSAGNSDDEVVELVYLATLSRRPTSTERHLVRRHLADSKNRADGFGDLQHALLISNEFLLRH